MGLIPVGIQIFLCPMLVSCRLIHLSKNLHYFCLLSGAILKSCSQLLQICFTSSGVSIINSDGGKPMQVLCNRTRDVWTAPLTSILIGNPRLKNGFGDLNGEFWLGYDNLQRLTATVDVILRVGRFRREHHSC